MRNRSLEGRRITFIATTDPYTRLTTGERGTIKFVDDMGTLHVQWDSGSTLGMVPGEDSYRIEEEL